MRKSLVLFGLAAVFAAANAAPVDPDAALSRALGDMPKRVAGDLRNYSLAITEKADGEATLYVFSRPGGFVIAPADDQFLPMLGYGDGPLTDKAGNVAPEFRYWIETISSRIAATRGAEGQRRVTKARPYREPIPVLCTTRWNQDSPYNDLCPREGIVSGPRSVTGCSATATAQVMKYHNWPPTGEGSITYSMNGRNVSTEFDKWEFEWGLMLDSYGDDATEAEKTAVARLMRQVGFGLKMQYSASGSGAYSVNLGPCIGSYFKYDKSCRYLNRDFYQLYEWEDIIYNSLKNDGPVLYNGQSYAGGHSFVCDGYDKDGLFHFNWGWGGISDGYFMLDALDPLEQGIGGSTSGFDFAQDVLVGIRPDRSGTSVWDAMLACNGSLDMTYDAAQDAITVGNLLYNLGPGTISGGEVAFKYSPVDASGATTGEAIYFSFVSFDEENSLEPRYGFRDFSVPLPTLQQGRYEVGIVYKIGDGEWRDLRCAVYDVSKCLLTIDGASKTLTPMEQALPEVTEINYPESLPYANPVVTLTGKLTAPEGEPYFNYLMVLLLDSEQKNVVGVGRQSLLDIPNGGTGEFTYTSGFSNLLAEPGRNYLALGVTDGTGFSMYPNVRLLGDPVAVDLTSGVEEVEIIDETEAREYFTPAGTLAGKAAAGEPRPALAPGVYIERADGKARKILVK